MANTINKRRRPNAPAVRAVAVLLVVAGAGLLVLNTASGVAWAALVIGVALGAAPPPAIRR